MAIRAAWEAKVLPHLIERMLNDRVVGRWRDRVCSAVSGDVLEIGFGSGLNLPYYAPDVRRVLAVEPSELAWHRAQGRIADFPGEVARIGLDGARIELPDQSVDAVVSTWTLCTIPDLSAALGEIRRALKPGAKMHFIEHALSPDAGVARAQQRIQPVWGPVAGGCHIDRDLPRLIEDAGFTVHLERARYVTKLPPGKPWGWFNWGTATPLA